MRLSVCPGILISVRLLQPMPESTWRMSWTFFFVCLCSLPLVIPFHASFLPITWHSSRIRRDMPTPPHTFPARIVHRGKIYAGHNSDSNEKVLIVIDHDHASLWPLICGLCCSRRSAGLPAILCAKEAGSSSYAAQAIKTHPRSGT
jgi:hypothetical protein